MQKLKIIIVSGLPGSGKSTLSDALARKLQIPIFSVDPIESSIIKSGLPKSYETGLAAYLVAETLAEEQLELGISVVVDAVNPVQEARDMWINLSNKHSAKLYFIECNVDEETHKKRIENRVRNIHGLSEVTWKDVENRKKEYLPWKENILKLDTSEPNEINIEKILSYLEA